RADPPMPSSSSVAWLVGSEWRHRCSNTPSLKGARMKKIIASAMLAGGLLMAMQAGAQAAPSETNGQGYWAGRLCDHVGPTTGGTTYWQSRNYPERGACVSAEGQSLKRGEWDPNLPPWVGVI